MRALKGAKYFNNLHLGKIAAPAWRKLLESKVADTDNNGLEEAEDAQGGSGGRKHRGTDLGTQEMPQQGLAFPKVTETMGSGHESVKHFGKHSVGLS